MLGIAVDQHSQRSWVTNSDLGVGLRHSAQRPRKLAGVGSYDLSSGRVLQSRRAATPAFLSDEEFRGPAIHLNGIVHHPKGFLLLSHLDEWIAWTDPTRPTLLHRARRAELRVLGALTP